MKVMALSVSTAVVIAAVVLVTRHVVLLPPESATVDTALVADSVRATPDEAVLRTALAEMEQRLTSTLNNAVAGVRSDMSSLDRRLTSVEQGPISDSLEAEPTMSADEPGGQQVDRRQPDHDAWSAEDERQLLAESVAAEPVDSQWSTTAAESVRGAFVDERFDSLEVVSVDCRSTLCRLDLESNDIETILAAQQHLPAAVADVLPRYTISFQHKGDRVTAVAYLARDGYKLSSTDEPEP